MIIDVDMIQRCKVGGIFLLQVYKVLTGTLFSLFIPQKCEEGALCSLEDNYLNDDPYHLLVFYWNVFSCCTFLTYYVVELRREEWAIKYLDIDNDKSDNSLKEIIRAEPILDKKMDSLNYKYYRGLQVTGGIYGINLLLSIKLLKDNYHSSATISTFISFSLLVLMKLYNSYVVAKNSVSDDKMLSAFMSEFVSYNVLDADYLQGKEKLLDIIPSTTSAEKSRILVEDPVIDIEDIVPDIQKD